MFDGLAFYAFPFGQDLCGPAVIGIRRGHVAQALMVALMIVVLDEGADLGLEVAGQEVVLASLNFVSSRIRFFKV
jgi:hypothetical protein